MRILMNGMLIFAGVSPYMLYDFQKAFPASR